MISVHDAVHHIVLASDTAQIALQRGILNMSAYADEIHKEVEARTKKSVRLGTIVVALSRLREEIDAQEPLIPQIPLRDLMVQTGIVEVVYERTAAHTRSLQKLSRADWAHKASFFSTTRGIGEIAIFASQRYTPRIRKQFTGKPQLVVKDLAALTVRVDESCLRIPNVFYALLRPFAIHRIPLIEVISTATEMTFFVEKQHMARSIDLLSAWYERGDSTTG